MNFVLSILVFVFVITVIEVETQVSQVRGRIFGGAPVSNYKQCPSQVRLEILLKDGRIGNCGGSVIDRNWILTAAHCFDYKENIKIIKIYLGSIRRGTSNQNFNASLEDVIKHPNYNELAVRNDIALIRTKNITFNEYIQRVELPDSLDSYVNSNVTVCGWGRTEKTNIPMRLQFTTMQVISNEICKEKHTNEMVRNRIQATNICAIGQNSGTCMGDSGGPMVLSGTNKQIGMSSFGSAEGCGGYLPRMYTRITSYLKWINYVKNKK